MQYFLSLYIQNYQHVEGGGGGGINDSFHIKIFAKINALSLIEPTLSAWFDVYTIGWPWVFCLVAVFTTLHHFM